MEQGRKKEFKISSGRSLSKGSRNRETRNSLDIDRGAVSSLHKTPRTPNKSASQSNLPRAGDPPKSANKIHPTANDLAHMDKYLEKNLMDSNIFSQKDSKSNHGDDHDRQFGPPIPIRTPVTGTKQLTKGRSIILDAPKPRA